MSFPPGKLDVWNPGKLDVWNPREAGCLEPWKLDVWNPDVWNPSQARPIAAAVVNAICGFQPSADSGSVSAVAVPDGGRPASFAREGVGPRVPANPGRPLCYAARLDGAGTSRGKAGRFRITWPQSWTG